MGVRRWIVLLLVARVSSVLTLDSAVRCTKTEPVVLGENATISCNLTRPEEVVQITWANGSETVATNSHHGPQVREKFADHFSISPWHGDYRDASSSLYISNLKKEHEGCYTSRFTIKVDTFVTGEICLTNVGKKFTCRHDNQKHVVLAYPSGRESKVDGPDGNKERDVEASFRFICTESRKQHPLKETPAEEEETYILECRVSVTVTPDVYQNITENAPDNFKLFTDVDFTNSLQSLLAAMFPGQNISCIWTNGTKDDSEATKALMAVLIPTLLLGGALVIGIVLYCRSKRSNNKIREDGSPTKSSEEIPLDKVSTDDSEKTPDHSLEETPTKDSSLMNAENNGLLSNATQHVARKLF